MLLDENKKLMAEWDWEKNEPLGLDPHKLAARSNKQAWWKCSKGHTWKTTIDKRTTGQNCPFCSNRRLLTGYNDLLTRFPELAQEWDCSKNELSPSQITFNSTKKAWWKCRKCGESWLTAVRERTIDHTGCPHCARKLKWEKRIARKIAENGSLADTDLLQDWNYEKNGALDPRQLTPQCSKKVWWKCHSCGYEWEADVANRSNGRGCPLCSNKTVVQGINDLSTTDPELAAEWHPTKNRDLLPTAFTRGSGKKVWWLCPKGHEYQATILHRSSGTNCPICNSGRQTSFAEQAFFYYIKQIFPDAVSRCQTVLEGRMELDIYIPSRKWGIEYDGSFWHKGRKTDLDILKYHRCKEKGIHLIRIKEQPTPFDLDMADEVFSTEKLDSRKQLQSMIQFFIDRYDPESNMWTRTQPHHFYSSVRVDLDRDRFEIEKYRQDKGSASLVQLYPALAKEWHPSKNGSLTPDMFSPGSDERVWWKCSKCGETWQASIAHRVSGTGCPACYAVYRKTHHPEAREIHQYALDGTFIKTWHSLSEAGRVLSINPANISTCAKHKRPAAGGYKWGYSASPGPKSNKST